MVGILKNKFHQIVEDPFWKNVATLFSGSAIAQALPILIFPFLTRIYSKEALGFYFVFVGIGMITQIIVSLQYELAILLPKDKKDSNAMVEMSFLLVFANSLILLFLIMLLSPLITPFIKQKEFISFIYWIPLSTFLLGVFNVISHYLNREILYKSIAIGKISKSILFSIVQLTLGFLGYLKAGLIAGLLAGQALSALYLFYCLFKKTAFRFQWNWTLMKYLAKVYKDMPLFNTTISFLSTLSNQLPVFFLSRYYGASASGDYGLANRVVLTPMELVGSSVGQVFFQEAAHLVNTKGNLHQLVKVTYLRLFKIAVIPFLLLLLFAPWLFSLFFSAEYVSSGQITQLLIPWLFLNFLNSPVSYLFDVLNKQRFMTILYSGYLMVRIAGLLIGYFVFQNIFITVAIYSAIGVLFNCFIIYYYLRISKLTNYQTYH
jgi:O-antigen/teichoic acid export membrane protein